MAEYFIRHPLRAVVAALLLTIIGVLAAFRLPVAEYPNIAPPTVSVSTNYLGADAAVVQDTVAKIIESEIRGLDGLVSMVSHSDASGGYRLELEFASGVNGDIAAVNVQNRIASVQSSLPSAVQSYGIDTSRSSSDMVFAMSLCSPKGTYDSIFLQNYAKTHFIDQLKRVSGVGRVEEYTEDYAMRIWLIPDRLADNALTVADVTAAINEQNVLPAAGVLGKMPMAASQEKQKIGRVQNRKETPEDFGNIIVKAEKGRLLRLKDVAHIAEGRRDMRYASFQDGKEAASYSISLTNDANALETIGEVKRILAEAETFFPPDMECRIVVDRTKFIRASMEEVSQTFAEALILVIIIVYFFLGSVNVTLVTLLTVPVSLIATLFVLYLGNFSLNLLTLFALILAIGLVVDDAIVVIEGVSRQRQRGLKIQEAASAAVREVQSPIIAITLVLAAVFLPAAFLSGVTGELYRQFALTLAAAMGISAFTALSLTPALCVLLLREDKPTVKGNGGILRRFSLLFKGFQQRYLRLLGKCMRRGSALLAALFFLTLGTGALYNLLPTEFLPAEDQGYFIAGVNLPPGTSLNRTGEVMNRLTEKLREGEGLEGIIGIAGVDLLSYTTQSDAGILFVALKDWAERREAGGDLDELFSWAEETAAKHTPEAGLLLTRPPTISGLGGRNDLSLHLLDTTGHSEEELLAVAEQITAAAGKRKELDEVETGFNLSAPYTDFRVNEDRAKELGVNLADVYTALRVNFGGEEVNDFTRFGQVYKTVLQAEAPFRGDADTLGLMFVKNNAGEMVPLSALLQYQEASGPMDITRYNGARSINFEAAVGEGYSLGEAMDAMEEVIAEISPAGFQPAWEGESRHAKRAAAEVLALLGLSLVCIFLCLVALYESWRLPLAVLFSVPIGVGGVLLTELAAGEAGSIYMQIGILLVIALAVKNAILIVEFAKERANMSPLRATLTAAKLRLRPILMTSLAFIVGCLPLTWAEGAGAGARCNMGFAVVGGMTAATVLGIFLVPVLFVALSRNRKAKAR